VTTVLSETTDSDMVSRSSSLSKAPLLPLPTRPPCPAVATPIVCRSCMCAYVCMPLYVHVKMRDNVVYLQTKRKIKYWDLQCVKMCRWSDKYLANISKTVTTNQSLGKKKVARVQTLSASLPGQVQHPWPFLARWAVCACCVDRFVCTCIV